MQSTWREPAMMPRKPVRTLRWFRRSARLNARPEHFVLRGPCLASSPPTNSTIRPRDAGRGAMARRGRARSRLDEMLRRAGSAARPSPGSLLVAGLTRGTRGKGLRDTDPAATASDECPDEAASGAEADPLIPRMTCVPEITVSLGYGCSASRSSSPSSVSSPSPPWAARSQAYIMREQIWRDLGTENRGCSQADRYRPAGAAFEAKFAQLARTRLPSGAHDPDPAKERTSGLRTESRGQPDLVPAVISTMAFLGAVVHHHDGVCRPAYDRAAARAGDPPIASGLSTPARRIPARDGRDDRRHRRGGRGAARACCSQRCDGRSVPKPRFPQGWYISALLDCMGGRGLDPRGRDRGSPGR
jgi:hypothetical protein